MEYCEQMRKTGQLEERRQQQNLTWVKEMADDYFRNMLYKNPSIAGPREAIEQKVLSGEMAPTKALTEIVRVIETQFHVKD